MKEDQYAGLMYCAECRLQADEVEFMPTDGNPAPWVCPVCGRTEVFTVDEEQTEIGLRNWPD